MERNEIKLLINYLENNPEHLNSLQNDFVIALKKHYNATGVITKKQIECLYQIKEYIPSMVPGNSVIESDSDRSPAQYSTFDSLTSFYI